MFKALVIAFCFCVTHCSRITGNQLFVERNQDSHYHQRYHEVVRRSSSGMEPQRPRIIYITPENADHVIDQIQMPSWQQMRDRRRPFTFFVEGIVGTGKSTLLKPFQKYPMMDILPEPVDKWINLNGSDLLQLIYDDPKRWSTTQESYVQLTMLEEHLRTGSILKAMERSMHSARHCFTEYFYQAGQMQQVEYALLDSWYQFLTNSDVTGFNVEADAIFYLQTDPRTAYLRVKNRGRPQEANISMDFLNGLHRLHEDWLIHGNATETRVPSPVVYVVNTEHSLEEMNRIYRLLANRFWHLLPMELKNRQCWMY